MTLKHFIAYYRRRMRNRLSWFSNVGNNGANNLWWLDRFTVTFCDSVFRMRNCFTQFDPMKWVAYLTTKNFCTETVCWSLDFNNNSDLYLHDYNSTASQKRRKHDKSSNLVIRVATLIYIMTTFIQFYKKGQINLKKKKRIGKRRHRFWIPYIFEQQQ